MPDISEGERVSPPCAKITWPPVAFCLGALSLNHSREPGESAAALTVEHQFVRHQIDVIDQNERDACGRVRRRASKADAADWNKQKASGKTAGNEEHGGMLPRSEVEKPGGPPDAHFEITESSNFYDFKWFRI
jgi:hypothetical protein